ncbi:MAG: septal ring lytic transglycosylase RlpA family protein [Holosporales bacterium]|nr:septal ring lytic transglycosylase RlpA family protein [Holosporales bacterium]
MLYRLAAALTILLTGCTSIRTPAGPTCVSCKPYIVRGSWYFPQKYYEYDETGLASYYGQECHGKPKATGAPFNKMAMTAAHRTLPLPSVVRVTSLVTGKSVIVIVDDRGPYCYRGRIIDLSYGVAKMLGIADTKPSMVRVQCLVADSLKLSRYIHSYCRNRKDPFGRTWAQLYFQEILGIGPKYYGASEEPKTSAPKAHPPQKKKKPKRLGSYIRYTSKKSNKSH